MAISPRPVSFLLSIAVGVHSELRKVSPEFPNTVNQSKQVTRSLELSMVSPEVPGKESYSLARNVRMIPLTDLAQIDG